MQPFCNTNSVSTKLANRTGYICLSVCLFGLGVFLTSKITNKDTWEIDPCSDPEEIGRRQMSRGTVASIIAAVTFGALNALLDSQGSVDSATSTALIGLLLGGTVGYLADNMIGTERGMRLWKNSKRDSINYAFGVLASAAYSRYLVTVLLDMFISLCIFSVIFPWLLTKPFFNCHPALANGIVSAIIGMATFQAYTNQTRFLWAYPDRNTTEKQQMDSNLIYIAVVLAGVIFMQTNTCAGFMRSVSGEIKIQKHCEGINNRNVKGWLMIGLLLALTCMSYLKWSDAPIAYSTVQTFYKKGQTPRTPPDAIGIYEEESTDGTLVTSVYSNPELSPKTILNKAVIGKIMFIALLIITVGATVRTSKLTGASTILNMDKKNVLWMVCAGLISGIALIIFLNRTKTSRSQLSY